MKKVRGLRSERRDDVVIRDEERERHAKREEGGCGDER